MSDFLIKILFSLSYQIGCCIVLLVVLLIKRACVQLSGFVQLVLNSIALDYYPTNSMWLRSWDSETSEQLNNVSTCFAIRTQRLLELKKPVEYHFLINKINRNTIPSHCFDEQMHHSWKDIQTSDVHQQFRLYLPLSDPIAHREWSLHLCLLYWRCIEQSVTYYSLHDNNPLNHQLTPAYFPRIKTLLLIWISESFDCVAIYFSEVSDSGILNSSLILYLKFVYVHFNMKRFYMNWIL